MIIAALVLGLFGFGMYDAYKQEESPSAKLVCESGSPRKCAGFSPETGFLKQEEEKWGDEFEDSKEDISPEEKARGYFVKRSSWKAKRTVSIDRSPALAPPEKNKNVRK